jgi:hypothetical protein
LMISGQFSVSQWRTGFLYGCIVVGNHPCCQSSYDHRTVCIAWNDLSWGWEILCEILKNVLIHRLSYIQIDFWCTWLSLSTVLSEHTDRHSHIHTQILHTGLERQWCPTITQVSFGAWTVGE